MECEDGGGKMPKLRAAQRWVEELTEELAAARGAINNQSGVIYVLPKHKKLNTFSEPTGLR